ncbi:MAG TPA: hypothetical protein VHO28_12385 [Ignavibacteriales bacterium]|nr:hypothetical protein [Ignavibacteriales bacterium]
MEPNELANVIMEAVNSLSEASGWNVSEGSRTELETALIAAKRSKVEDYHRIEEIMNSVNISEIEDHMSEILNLYIELGRIGIWNAGLGSSAFDFMYTSA